MTAGYQRFANVPVYRYPRVITPWYTVRPINHRCRARTKVLITSSRSSTENNRAIIYDARVGTSLLHGYANDKRAPDRPAFWNPTFVCAPRRARPPSSSFNVSRRPLCFILRSLRRRHSIFSCCFIGFQPVDSFHERDLTLKYFLSLLSFVFIYFIFFFFKHEENVFLVMG